MMVVKSTSSFTNSLARTDPTQDSGPSIRNQYLRSPRKTLYRKKSSMSPPTRTPGYSPLTDARSAIPITFRARCSAEKSTMEMKQIVWASDWRGT